MVMDIIVTMVILNFSVAVEEEGGRWGEERGRRRKGTRGCFLEMLTFSLLLPGDVNLLFFNFYDFLSRCYSPQNLNKEQNL